MEIEPNTENVVYLDEYPELAKRIWLRKMAAQRLSKVAVMHCIVIPFEKSNPPNNVA